MANASKTSAKFQWDDPFHLDAQLTDDERAVSEAARAYCQEKLAPRVQLAFRNEHTELSLIHLLRFPRKERGIARWSPCQ